MNYIQFKFSQKSLDMIGYPSRIDVLEGTARSSKSTSVMFKFGLKVNASEYNQFFVAGSTAVVARRNLIDNKNGFKELFKGIVREGTDNRFGNHLIFTDTIGREKVIYIFGFRDKSRWEVVLGSTMAAGVIDEINTSDLEFINQVERSMASVPDAWFGCTLNPDNPDKEIYEKLINRARPLRRWTHDIPSEILHELKKQKNVRHGAVYWHFNFKDNPAMTEELIDNFKAVYPIGSMIYNSLVVGIRGIAEGTIFGQYLDDSFFVRKNEYVFDAKKQLMNDIEYLLKTNQYIRYSIGIDLGNNVLKKGTVLTFTGIQRGYIGADFIDAISAKSTEANDLVIEICDKIIEWYKHIVDRSRFDGVYIDGYGSIEILIPTIRKRLSVLGYSQIRVDLCIKFGTDGGRKARMMLLLLLINQKKIRFNPTEGCKKLYSNLRKIVYNEKDGLPMDENKEENDYYDSACYSITPFTTKLNEDIIRFIN